MPGANAGNQNISYGKDGDLKRQSQPISSRETCRTSFECLNRLDSKNAILAMIPVIIADARQSLAVPVNAEKLARDLQYVSKAFLLDENELAAAQTERISVILCPKNKSYKALLADYLSRCGRAAEANEYFALFKQEDLLDPVILASLAQYKMRNADANSARLVLENASSRQEVKTDPWLQSMRARAWLRSGFNKRAAELFLSASELVRNDYCKNIWRANAYLMGSQWISARKSLIEAGRCLPDDPVWHSDLAQVGEKTDDRSHTEQLALSLSAPRVCTRAYVNYVHYAQTHGHLNWAHNCLRYISKLRPYSAELKFVEARLARAEKKTEEALLLFQQGIKLNPSYLNAYLDQANIYYALQQPDKALLSLIEATKMCPNSARGWQMLGDYWRQHRKQDDALACYRNALDKIPAQAAELNIVVKNEMAQLHADLACIYFNQGLLEKASQEATLFNKYKVILELPGHLNSIHFRPGRLNKKMELQSEEDIQQKVLLADALFETKNYKEAAALYTKAIAINGENPDLHSYLLYVLTESGDWNAALTEDFQLSNSLIRKIPGYIGDFLHQNGSN
jgi:predicted Zn-dependent protease